MQVALIVSALVASTSAAADLACVAEFGLCDTGAPCCNTNSTCHRFDDNVAQCLPASHEVKNTHERAASSEASRVCATTWSQCNGQNWSNGVCCVNANDECVKHNDYYSQCIPKSSATTTATPATSAPSNVQCSENWSQCNGQNWPNGVCCKDPSFQCNRKSQYVSLCEPKDPKKAAEASCTNVSVVGDATYCVQGAICGDQGDVCPKKGDYAVESCLQTLKSYVGATKCVAPVDATCQKLPSGARGCVFGAVPATTTGSPATTTAAPATTTSSPATTTTASPATTSANTGKCSTNWSQCNGQNWPYGVCCEDSSFSCNYKNQYLSLCEPKDPKKAAEASCTNVSVVGDATYCVQGAICGDQGDVCPKKGDYAVASCLQTLKSYVGATSSCVAPADATCQKLPSGARGCVFGTVPATTTGSPATTTAAVPATTSANTGKCSTNWSQCNGQNWPHGVCCEDSSFSCNYKNQYLSLCEPKQPKKEAEATWVATVWQQCGGRGFGGPTQCTTGNTCQVINEWYSQCKPAPTQAGVLNTWERCGGIGHNGLVKCRDEDKCHKYNDHYSQCIPK